jgi:hypothetical protein
MRQLYDWRPYLTNGEVRYLENQGIQGVYLIKQNMLCVDFYLDFEEIVKLCELYGQTYDPSTQIGRMFFYPLADYEVIKQQIDEFLIRIKDMEIFI